MGISIVSVDVRISLILEPRWFSPLRVDKNVKAFSLIFLFEKSVIFQTALFGAHRASHVTSMKEHCECNYNRVAFIKPFNYTDHDFVYSIAGRLSNQCIRCRLCHFHLGFDSIFHKLCVSNVWVMLIKGWFFKPHDSLMPCDS